MTSSPRPLVLIALASLLTACSSSAPGGATGGTGGSSTGGSGGTSTGGSSGSGGSTTGGSGGSGGSTTGGSGGTSSGGSGGSGGSASPDGGGSTTPDGGGVAVDSGAPPAGQCGTMMPDLKITGKESVIFGPDGTAYSSSRDVPIGKSAPPYDKPQDNWAMSPTGTIFGIILDPKKKVLYGGARNGGQSKLYAISTDDPTKVDTVMGVEGGINGVTLGDDGFVYYSDQNGGNLWAVDPTAKTKAQVNKTGVPQANGVAFAPDGRLCAATYTTPATMICLKLDANRTEMSRDLTMVGGKNGDGLAFDKSGNAYMTAGALYKIATDGKVTMANPTGGTGIEFGAGPINCKTIYVAGPIHAVPSDVEGADVPWHRP